MSNHIRDVPIGIRIIQKLTEICCRTTYFNRDLWYRSSVWVLTFLAYMSYHATRKTLSVVKTQLHRNCSGLVPLPSVNATDPNWCDWKPFDGPDSTKLLGALDSSFLFAYAGAMFISGIVAERVSLRYFLALGMIFSGISCYLLGFAKIYNIHSMLYFVLVQVFGGIVQTTGWPGVVAVMGNWFEKAKRGLIMGIWNSHTSIGNIVGTLMAGYYLEKDWSMSFIVPGLMIAVVGFLNFLFLVTNPADVGCTRTKGPEQPEKRLSGSDNLHANAETSGYRRVPSVPPPINSDIVVDGESPDDDIDTDSDNSSTSDSKLLSSRENIKTIGNEGHPILANGLPDKPVGFVGALCIPGVIEYSLCLFFAKLVSYTFLYWLPLYIKSTTTYSATLSADISTWFDVGGILGGIAAGLISDYSGMSATTCAGMLLMAIPVLFVYYLYGAGSIILNMALLFSTGILVNGPYALITTAVSAELGTHHSLAGNSKALATVTAIIDGTGSIGAAVGPLLAGLFSNMSWEYVFYLLMLSDLLALVLLIRLVSHEIKRFSSSNFPSWSP